MRRLLAALLLGASLAGCAVNPVTGRSELQFVSEAQEIALGEQHYGPTRQMQGGDYVVDPGLTDYVDQVGQRLAAVSDRPELPYEFVVLNNSVPNAWALPGGKIAVNRGLLVELGSEAELAAVLGHEIVHAAARHGAKAQERGLLLQGALIATQITAADNQYAGLIMPAAAVGAQLISQRYSREAELESDRYGMEYMARAGYDPTAAVDLQRTFVRLSEGRSQDWLSGLFASHPPSQARVEANLSTAQELGASGEMGRDRYQTAIASLLRTEDAYADFDRAVAAASNGDLDTAESLVSRALRAEPREAKFHTLLGDIASARSRYDEAEAHYDRAVERNPSAFQAYLGRGLAREARGDETGAERDLEQSVRLLPTATAIYSLGRVAQRDGRLAEARQYYAEAAGSDSAAGREAGRALARIELADNPSRYFAADVRVDDRGQAVVLLRNDAAVPVRDLTLAVNVLDPSLTRIESSRPYTLANTMAPGEIVRFDTGIGPISDAAQLQRLQVQVRSASVAD